MSDKPLSTNVYLALAAIGWADGNLDKDEVDAIARTALEDGVDFDEVGRLEKAIEEPVEIGSIEWREMSKQDRLFVYAVASWMTRLDNVVTDTEEAALAALGEALSIPDRPREHADAIAREVAALPAGDRPFRFDIPKLRQVIATRLEQAQVARAAQKARDAEEEA